MDNFSACRCETHYAEYEELLRRISSNLHRALEGMYLVDPTPPREGLVAGNKLQIMIGRRRRRAHDEPCRFFGWAHVLYYTS